MRSYKGLTWTSWLPWQWGHKTTNGIFLFMFLLLICEPLFIEVARVELLGAVEVAKTQQRWIFLSCPLPPVKQCHHPTLILSHRQVSFLPLLPSSCCMCFVLNQMWCALSVPFVFFSLFLDSLHILDLTLSLTLWSMLFTSLAFVC